MRVLTAIIVGLVAFAWSAAAFAAETIAYGPAPAWVKPFHVPEGKADAAGAVEVLMLDSQLYLSRRGLEEYTASAAKALTAQGLRSMGTLMTSWDPARESLTIHRAELRRGDQVINLLASAEKFQVLRRETNLSRAVLDGTLTGILEVHGLRVGDVVVLETSTAFNDPLLGGHADTGRSLQHSGKAGRIRYRQVWDQARPVQWKATEFYGAVRKTESANLVELEAEWRDVEAPVAPENAPGRFAIPARIHVSDYQNWAAVSNLMAPLYAKATALASDSPLKAEARKIMEKHKTPEARALAALQIVETDIRYLAITMGSGGYLPANADDTWNRRFGDCKAKTVLLVALLRELGIEAEAALVASDGGNGLDEQLPGMSLFDHVIVRARIEGKTYWLDGTRSGDRALVTLSGPPFDWALPVRLTGATLERVERVPPTRPLREVVNLVDASGGFERKAPGKVQIFLRGDSAVGLEVVLGSLDAAEAEKLVKERYEDSLWWLDVTSISYAWDEAALAYKVEFSGRGQYEWERNGRGYSGVVDTDFGMNRSARPTGPWADAPFDLGYPLYNTELTRIRLPADLGGAMFTSGDANFEGGGVQMSRKVRLEGNEAIVESVVRALQPESLTSATLAAEREIQRSSLGKDVLLVTGVGSPGSPEARAFGLLQRAREIRAGDVEQALRYVEESLALDSRNVGALQVKLGVLAELSRYEEAAGVARTLSKVEPSADSAVLEAISLLVLGRYRPALAKADEALAYEPRMATAFRARAIAEAGLDRSADMVKSLDAFYVAQDEDEDFSETLSEIAKIIALKPARQQQTFLRGLATVRGSMMAHWVTGHILMELDPKTAPAQFDEAIRLKPDLDDLRWSRLDAQVAAEAYEAALVDANYFVAKSPKGARSLTSRASVFEAMKDFKRASADYDTATQASKANSVLLNEACWYRATNNIELEQALSECTEAVRLRPDFTSAWDSRGLVNLRLGRMKDAIADYDKSLMDQPEAASLYGRAIAKQRAGDLAGSQADANAAIKLEPAVAKIFETFGLKL